MSGRTRTPKRVKDEPARDDPAKTPRRRSAPLPLAAPFTPPGDKTSPEGGSESKTPPGAKTADTAAPLLAPGLHLTCPDCNLKFETKRHFQRHLNASRAADGGPPRCVRDEDGHSGIVADAANVTDVYSAPLHST